MADHNLLKIAETIEEQQPSKDLENHVSRLEEIASTLGRASTSPTWSALASDLRETVKALRETTVRLALESTVVVDGVTAALTDLHALANGLHRVTEILPEQGDYYVETCEHLCVILRNTAATEMRSMERALAAQNKRYEELHARYREPIAPSTAGVAP